MMSKQQKVSLLKTKLETAFVDNYDDINTAKTKINEYFIDVGIDYKYDYNTFCKDFIKESLFIVNRIDNVEKLDLNNFIYIVLTNLISNKNLNIE